ncbi:hypothetical protein BCR33DRAFT_788456 [Rhizoclosmatium globosum]|uniref:ABC-type glycine betaine transport system substrate-binding domain-containing protein n=1 Tax=Rhizoclosmatium globosum TaxID=329046 RepID=A0A1Y2BY63_9FUNG|nr:hypothetical protein BCR33DRAFT_788456 [Rhizoclosmatium globosum]|eukprot:ORY39005.1 hypothetical protein BCR33DRAFT_788456 [Rhizoclosmatium globosum]
MRKSLVWASPLAKAIFLLFASSSLARPTALPSDLDADFEGQTNNITSCLDSSYAVKHGWASFSNFTQGKREIELEVDWWDSGIMAPQIMYYLLTDVMGYKVDFKVYDGGSSTGRRLNYGTVDLVLELWQSDASSWYQQYIQLDSTVLSYGSIGYSGRVGLYFPSYMWDQHPEYNWLDYFKALNYSGIQNLFPRAGTAPVGTKSDGTVICDGDVTLCSNGTYKPAWYKPADNNYFAEIWCNRPTNTPYYFQRLIDGLKLNLTMVFLSDNGFSYMADAYSKKQPFLYYNWRPTVTVSQFNFTRMIFPDDVLGDFKLFQANPSTYPLTTDIPVETLFKATSTRFSKDFPELSYLVSKFLLSDRDIKSMLAKLGPNVAAWSDPSYADATCTWLKQNEDIWGTWIPPPPQIFTKCPIGTGRYLVNSLWVCIACPVGTYNLNETTSQQCTDCLANANCLGGAIMTISANHWMSEIPALENITGDYIPDIHDCPYKKQCCPNGNCTSDKVCADEFGGPLCVECKDSEMFAWNQKCLNCSGPGVSFFLTLFMPLLVTIGILYLPSFHASEMEQFCFYYQVVNLIFSGGIGEVIGWDGMNTILALFSLDIEALVFDCPLPIKGVAKHFFRFALPLLFVSYFLFFYALVTLFPSLKAYLPQRIAKQNMNVLFSRAFVLVFNFIFMPLVEASLVLVECVDIEHHSVLYKIPSIECYSQQHAGPAAFAYIVLIILLFIYPAGLLSTLLFLRTKGRILHHHSDETHNPMDRIIEPFYISYRPSYFFMEAVQVWERAIIVLCFTYLHHAGDEATSVPYLGIFITICLIRIYIQPFKNESLLYLSREIGISFIALLFLNQYANHVGQQKPTVFILFLMVFPVVNHLLRWAAMTYRLPGHLDGGSEMDVGGGSGADASIKNKSNASLRKSASDAELVPVLQRQNSRDLLRAVTKNVGGVQYNAVSLGTNLPIKTGNIE